MDEVAKRRAERSGNSKDWSPADALEDALARVQATPDVKCCIALWISDDGAYHISYSASRLTKFETVGLLSSYLHQLISETYPTHEG